MTETISKHHKTLASIIHASTFSRYFIPFGQFILPLILWTINKKENEFVDYNGKQVLNFQLSMFLYSVVFGIASIPIFFSFFPNIFEHGFNLWDFNWGGNMLNFHLNWDHGNWRKFIWPLGFTGFFQAVLIVINLVYTILATIRTNEGQAFKYPLCIRFIK